MELLDSNPASNITETTDQPEFFSNWNVQFDGHRANASGAANVSEEETTDDDFYRHSSIVTTVYCLAYSFVFLLGLVGNCLRWWPSSSEPSDADRDKLLYREFGYCRHTGRFVLSTGYTTLQHLCS
ncbi:uncharacterized protein LOC123475865 isoform X2 [Daphnia magna]|uniref:uncharacterized protein LOC123475865 isoform X2 n=1 Tax=Daphnia magna TaxID=35525 RepID=UPI001E1BC2A8|nr:uncharacterized protein LOC123475865 isoform X2 [Daphnia magna]